MNDVVIVSIACANAQEADVIARALVEGRLAACVQSHAITSTYVWQGAVETAPEVMLTVKTLATKLPAIEACVKVHHSYEVPEIVAVPAAWVSTTYADWLRTVLET